MEPIEENSSAGVAEAPAGPLLMETQPPAMDQAEARLQAMLEAIVYVTDEPLAARQIAAALGEPLDRVEAALARLVAEYDKPEHGLSVREVAGGYQMATKAEHHDAIRAFVKNLMPPLKLSLAALETLAVIAYKQPVTAPEILEIRGVQGAGVLKTLLDRKLITTTGRKDVVGRPILYKTTKDFLVQFGLKDLSELPTLKEFEELRRMALADDEPPAPAPIDPQPTPDSTPPATGEPPPATQVPDS
jgi:segregation and condensation protein B